MTPTDPNPRGWCCFWDHPGCEGVSVPTAKYDGLELCATCAEREGLAPTPEKETEHDPD